MTPALAPLEARCDVWNCGPEVPELPLEELQYLLDHPPPMAKYRGAPRAILSMVRFMVPLANEFLMSYLTALGCLDLAVRIDPAAAGLIACLLARLPALQWTRARMLIDGCVQNLPGDRTRLAAAVARGAVPATELGEFDAWHARAHAARASADYVQARLQQAHRDFRANPDFDVQSLDRVTVGRCVATTTNLCLDDGRCMQRMQEAFRGRPSFKGCAIM